MGKVKLFINRFMITIMLSSIIFYTIKINTVQYFLIIFAVWFLLFLNYKFEKNIEFFDLLIITCLGNFVAYVGYKSVNGVISEKVFFVCSIIFLICLLYFSIRSFLLSLSKINNLDNERLLAKREKDLERLLNYLDTFDIVGIDAEWGTGKTFLINELKKNIRNKYEVIEIDILSCNLNELQVILIKEIEKVMYKYRIISRYSSKLKNFLVNEKFLKRLWNLIFPENYSYSEIIKGFKSELSKIDKPILIIYEDIDRISDEKVIKSIFGVSEKLSSNKIKIIYQYDECKLNVLGFDSDYLEKYIPYKMNLTEIDFFEIVKFVLDQNKINKNVLEIKDFDFMKKYNQLLRGNTFLVDKEIYLDFPNPSIRKVQRYIFELTNTLEIEKYKKYKDIVISFFFIKIFKPEVYNMINIGEGLIETLKFNFDSKVYTIMELINMKQSGELNEEKINNIFSDDKNKMKYCILRLFNYNNSQQRLQTGMNDSNKIFQNAVENEKKDRIVWHLLQSGKSKYTDYEYVGEKFIKDVLKKPTNKQLNAYNKFRNDLYYQSDKGIDNETIFKIGRNSFIELFKAFEFLGVTAEETIGLIDIYFEVNNVKEINKEFIETINSCYLPTEKVYIYLLKRINELEIVENLNTEKSFIIFLKKQINGLIDFKYSDINDYYINIYKNEERDKYIIQDIEKSLKEIKKIKERITNKLRIDEIKDNLDTIINFLVKMEQMIKFENKSIDNCVNKVNSDISRLPNQNEFERLKGLINKNSNFNEEIRKSYLDGKISIYQINHLINK